MDQINLWDRDRVNFVNGDNPRIKKRKDFLDPDRTNKCRDHDGHGTHCVGVIRTVAPEADVYVARVAVNRHQGPDCQAVIEAIDYAQTHWAVDIISLSFGFEGWVTPLERAIRGALDKRVLVLAATSNYGTSRPMTFPARMPDVISLHAADHSGRAAGTNPVVEYGKNLTILGVDVVSAWTTMTSTSITTPSSSSSSSLSSSDPPPRRAEGLQANHHHHHHHHHHRHDGLATAAVTRAMSGTSVATPVAAGVAALVLEFAGQRDPCGGGGGADDAAGTDRVLARLGPFLRRQHGMNSVFRAMAVPTGAGEFLNIVPWNLLRAEEEEGEDGRGGGDDDDLLGRRTAALALRSVIKNAFGRLVE